MPENTHYRPSNSVPIQCRTCANRSLAKSVDFGARWRKKWEVEREKVNTPAQPGLDNPGSVLTVGKKRFTPINRRGRVPTEKSKGEFLRMFQETGQVSSTCEALRIGRTTVYKWLKKDPDFKRRYQMAEEAYVEALESEVYRRAVEGVPTDKMTVDANGNPVPVRKYSDELLKWMIKDKRDRLDARRAAGDTPDPGDTSQQVVQIQIPDNGRGGAKK